MPLESLLDHILGEANIHRDRIIKEAQEETNRIIEKAKTQADSLYRQIIESQRNLALAEKQKLVVNARLEGKKRLLGAKQELINEVMETLKHEIKKEKFKKKQVLQDRIHEVPEDIEFYLAKLRQENETEIARILFG